MISIAANALNDPDQIADAISKLTFILNAWRKRIVSAFTCLDRIFAATFCSTDGGPILQTASNFGNTFGQMNTTAE